MDIDGLKWTLTDTSMDIDEHRWMLTDTQVDQNGHQWTPWTRMDVDGQMWTKMDIDGHRWTIMDSDGRRWTVMDVSMDVRMDAKMDARGQMWTTMDMSINVHGRVHGPRMDLNGPSISPSKKKSNNVNMHDVLLCTNVEVGRWDGTGTFRNNGDMLCRTTKQV